MIGMIQLITRMLLVCTYILLWSRADDTYCPTIEGEAGGTLSKPLLLCQAVFSPR